MRASPSMPPARVSEPSTRLEDRLPLIEKGARRLPEVLGIGEVPVLRVLGIGDRQRAAQLLQGVEAVAARQEEWRQREAPDTRLPRVVMVSDRESDFYELFARRPANVELIVRACQMWPTA